MAFNPNSNWQLLPEPSDSESDDETSFPTRPKRTRKDYNKILVLSKGTDMSHAWGATQSRFLLLPGEIRNLVYMYILQGQTKWNIRHNFECRYATRSGYSQEEDIPWIHRTGDRCDCVESHRQSLNLLFTCRQIRDEATPIWYQQNTLCFYLPAGADDAITRMRDLRAQVTDNIRHLSILLQSQSILFPEVESYKNYFNHNSWEVLLNLKQLQTLELPYEIFTVDAPAFKRNTMDAINQLCALPSFRQLKVVSLINISSEEVMTQTVMRVPTLLSLPLTPESLEAQITAFGNIRWLCAEAAETQGAFDEFLAWSYNSRKVMPRTRWRLSLGEGTTQWVQFYGFPNTRRSMMKMRREAEREAETSQADLRRLSQKKELEERKERHLVVARKVQGLQDAEQKARREERLEALRKAEEQQEKKQKNQSG